MDAARARTPGTSIDPATEIGWISLTVSSLAQSLQFYTHVLGFHILEQDQRSAVLGAAGIPLLILLEPRDVRPRPPRTTGLYHFAVLVPDRQALARSLRQLVLTRYGLDGAADHLVSEALYVSDPDGNGIEIYRDRPRGEWQWQGNQVQMGTEALDLAELVREAEEDGQPWTGLPASARIGHIHLQVADIPQTEAFYHGVLGFDVVAHLPGALFLSAGGYHHHVGTNTWQSRNAPPAPANAVGLRAFTIVAPTEAAQLQIATRLEVAEVTTSPVGHSVTLHDPSRNRIVLTSREDVLAAAARMGDEV